MHKYCDLAFLQLKIVQTHSIISTAISTAVAKICVHRTVHAPVACCAGEGRRWRRDDEDDARHGWLSATGWKTRARGKSVADVTVYYDLTVQYRTYWRHCIIHCWVNWMIFYTKLRLLCALYVIYNNWSLKYKHAITGLMFSYIHAGYTCKCSA